MELVTLGKKDAPIWVICEPPQKNYNPRNPTTASSLKLFVEEAVKSGLNASDFYFIQLCPPIPDEIKKSKAKTWKFVEPYAEQVKLHIENCDRPIVTMGDLATRAAVGRACAITKVRGTLLEGKIYPILPPAMCRVVLENLPLFKADLKTLAKLKGVDFDLNKLGNNDTLNRYWCTDIQHILDAKPQLAAVDTETTGLRTTQSDFRVLTVQIAISPTECAVCPLTPEFWPGEFDPVARDKLLLQIKELCEDKTIRKVGQNINYERHALSTLDIEINGVLADTQIMAWFIDENMITKTLDDLVRRFVPHLAGLNDQLNIELDKTSMATQPRDKVLIYSGNDGIMTYQLFWVMWNLLKENPAQMNLFLKLKMPGLYGFFAMEQQGVIIDQEYLKDIGILLADDLVIRKAALLERVPKAVIRKHVEEKKELSFTRDAFVRDILFSDIGFKLKPMVFTKSTKDLDKAEQVPSASAKDHLPYFTDAPRGVGDFVEDLIEYKKLLKLSSTYVNGFAEKYVHEDGAIHPKFNLHITVTGRSSSSGPNAQNFPSRGEWAKKYKKMITARPGYKFISADLSQIELRLIAWESRDPVMLQVYKEDRDIHTITAQAVTGINGDAWEALTKGEKKSYRTRAKAVNFGFCIAKGEPVLTNVGLVPIEEVRDWHLLWDGVEWVSHEGLIYMGEKEVIEYDGLIATPDHSVYTDDGRKIPLGELASKVHTGRIAIGEVGGVAIRYDAFDRQSNSEGTESALRGSNLHGMLNFQTRISGQFTFGQEQTLQVSEGEVPRQTSYRPRRTLRRHDTAVLSRHTRIESPLQGSWNTGTICLSGGLYSMGAGNVSDYRLQGSGFRQTGQRRTLLERESSPSDSLGELKEPRKVKVYDIINAGPRHRFTVSGKIVSNCYGMQWRKFKRFAKTDYKVDLTDREAEHYYDTYHKLYRNIKKWHHDRMYEAQINGFVTSIHGAVRHVPSVYSEDSFIKSQAERQAINSPIQSFGSDLGVLAIARLARQCDPDIMRPVMFIHDDVILEVKDGHEIEAVNALLYVLNNPPLKSIFGVEAPIPIKAEPDIGVNLGDMYPLYELEADDPPEYWAVAKAIDPKKPLWWDDQKDIK